MNKKIYLASPHMSDEGYEQEYVKEAFDTNWIAPLGENVNKFEALLSGRQNHREQQQEQQQYIWLLKH